MSPVPGWRSPIVHSSVVVLPDPLGPSRPKISPSWISKLTPSDAWTPPYRLSKSRTITLDTGLYGLRRDQARCVLDPRDPDMAAPPCGAAADGVPAVHDPIE